MANPSSSFADSTQQPSTLSSAAPLSPPKKQGLGLGMILAIGVHVVLLAALSIGVAWRTAPEPEATAQAELWARVPQTEGSSPAKEVITEKAPDPITPVDPPPPEVQQEVVVPPTIQKPLPPPVVIEKPDPAPEKLAELARQKEKQRLDNEAKKKAELKKAELKAEQQARKAAQEQKAKEEAKLEAKRLADQKAAEKLKQQEKLQQAKLAAEQKKREEAEQKKAQEEARLAKLRDENLKRIKDQLWGTGAGNTGEGKEAKTTGGPSASYPGKVKARVKPNVTFTEDIAGNISTDVEVRVAPDGAILSQKLLKPSGNKAWDEAVLRAIAKTASLPVDENGTAPPVLVLSFRPRDF